MFAREGSTAVEEGRYVVAVASDDAGVRLKDFIRDQLKEDSRVSDVKDFGVESAKKVYV